MIGLNKESFFIDGVTGYREGRDDSMKIQCKSGLLELCILSILQNEDCNGFEIYNQLEQDVKISKGTIYPTLRRLVKEGSVEIYYKQMEDDIKRKYYKLTDQGGVRIKALKQEWESLSEGVNHLIGGTIHAKGRIHK